MTARPRATDEEILSARTFHDPYEAMTDDEFAAYTARLFDDPQGPTRSITVRMPEALLVRLQHMASQRQMPYQRLMKRMLEESVAGLERRNSTAAPSGQRKPKARP
jgi:predicted DNA binding CopG/RHH family protein